MTTNNMVVDRELKWDDEISNDNDFQILPNGNYDFEIKAFERQRHPGSAKLPPCNKAVLKIKVYDEQYETTIEHNLFLHSKTEGFLCAFFRSIGARKHNEKLVMDWSKVVGAKGRCKIFIDEFESNKEKGKMLKSNKIERFLDPEEAAQSTSFEPGKF